MKQSKKILLLEDEENIAYALKVNLEAEGYEVTHAPDAKTAFMAIRKNSFHLLLLDVMLPDIKGYDVCKQFREHDKLTPILFISALNDHESKLLGLRSGADDFIYKPFDLNEVLLKIQRLLLRTSIAEKKDIVYFGNCWINFSSLEAKGIKENILRLSSLEFEIAKILIRNEGIPVSRDLIYQEVWGYGKENLPNTRTLDNFIVSIRRCFEKNPAQPNHFLSVRGIGYKFQS